MTEMTKAELIKKAKRLEAELAQINEQIGLMPNEPERWEPKSGSWYIHFNGSAQQGPTMNASRLIGSESQTRAQAEAKARARIARERLQTWVDEQGGPGNWGVMPSAADDGAWVAGRFNPLSKTPWDVTMSESTARRAADLLTRGVIKLEVEND